MNRIEVEITSVNKDGKTCVQGFQTDTLVSATRIMLTYKPKRGYQVVSTTVKDLEVLV